MTRSEKTTATEEPAWVHAVRNQLAAAIAAQDPRAEIERLRHEIHRRDVLLAELKRGVDRLVAAIRERRLDARSLAGDVALDLHESLEMFREGLS